MQEKVSDRFWTFPNVISLIRLVFGAPVTLILYHNGYGFVWAVFLFFVFTDWLDGYLARRYGWGSSRGMMLDPLADQFLVLPIFWMLYWSGIIGYIPPVFLTLREILMALVRFLAHKDIPANLLGKVKVVAEYIAITFLLAGGEWYLLGLMMFLLIMPLALVSLLKYAYDVFLRRERVVLPC